MARDNFSALFGSHPDPESSKSKVDANVSSQSLVTASNGDGISLAPAVEASGSLSIHDTNSSSEVENTNDDSSTSLTIDAMHQASSSGSENVDWCSFESASAVAPTRTSSTSVAINGSISEPESSSSYSTQDFVMVDLDEQQPPSSSVVRVSSTSDDAPNENSQSNHPSHLQSASPNTTTNQPTANAATRPGAESIQYLKKFGSRALITPLRNLQLAEKLHALSDDLEQYPDRLRRELEAREMERQQREVEQRRELEARDSMERLRRERELEEQLQQQSELLARELQEEEDVEECQRIKVEADMACQRVGERYDALVKFVERDPRGRYEDFIEYLLMGGGRSVDANGNGVEDYNALLFENFYDQDSEYRKLWNDNLTMGLSGDTTTLEGRVFVPAVDSAANTQQERERASSSADYADPWQAHYEIGLSDGSNSTRERTNSFGQRVVHSMRERTFSGDRMKKQIAQVDRQRIGSAAVNLFSNVSSFALKPLRELQLAEKLNAINLDMEDAETQKEIDKYNRLQMEKQDLEEMMELKREAEERTLTLTKDHLMGFIKEHPHGTYHEWIEDLHPENAHDGTLLEGLGKTIDHRFFVEESDHRRIWNEHLTTFVEVDSGETGRNFVPPRARQMNDNGELVSAADLLSGSATSAFDGLVSTEQASGEKPTITNETEDHGLDLIDFG